MSWIQLLLLFRRLPIRDLLNYPDDLTNVESVRLWLLAVTDAGGILTELTDTTIDDYIVDALRDVLRDKESFDDVYGLILLVFNLKIEDDSMAFKSHAYEISTRIGFSPAIIIAIVQVVIMLLKFIRERRES